eukprot:jgi/Ulvmu1/12917/UM099_0014.1
MGGGAWPFLVGGLPCQVDSGNERDLSLLNSDNIAIIVLQRGMPSKRESSSRVDYVPALCTHRPSLLPIERAGEALGLELRAGEPAEGSLKPIKPTPEHLRAPRLPRGERRPPFSEPPVSFVRGHPCDLTETTLNNGYLGSRNDEERSEMRYVVKMRPGSKLGLTAGVTRRVPVSLGSVCGRNPPLSVVYAARRAKPEETLVSKKPRADGKLPECLPARRRTAACSVREEPPHRIFGNAVA